MENGKERYRRVKLHVRHCQGYQMVIESMQEGEVEVEHMVLLLNFAVDLAIDWLVRHY